MPSLLQDPARLAALDATGLLNSAPENPFDRVTRPGQPPAVVPVALVSLVDTDRQFFKSSTGLPEPLGQQPADTAEPFVLPARRHQRRAAGVDDAREPSHRRHQSRRGDLGVVAYLGVPLTTPPGHVLGSLCAIDTKVRPLERP